VYPITYDLLRSVEKRLRNFLHESNQREQTLDMIKLLQQKKAWLEVDACEKRIESLGNAVAILADLLQQADQQLHSLQTRRVKAEKHSPLNKVW
jgi:predicted DsbA family dithiol-disulfide isomerase